MKKKIAIASAIIVIIILITAIVITKNNAKPTPELSQIKSICKLATLKTSYHNVARSKKTTGDKITDIGEKKREFWVEYTGYATIGIDMEKVSMEIKKDQVVITMPRAEVFNYSYDEKTMVTYEDQDNFLNSNKIGTEDRKKAVSNAQKEMKKEVEKNSAIMVTAEERAKELIANYIKQLGELSNKKYEIKWVIIEEK